MRHLSVMISEPLYEKLEHISQEKNSKISDVVRMILQDGVESQPPNDLNKIIVNYFQGGLANYAIMTYCLVEDAMRNLVTEGPMLSEKSHARAEKLINKFLEKVAKNSETSNAFKKGVPIAFLIDEF